MLFKMPWNPKKINLLGEPDPDGFEAVPTRKLRCLDKIDCDLTAEVWDSASKFTTPWSKHSPELTRRISCWNIAITTFPPVDFEALRKFSIAVMFNENMRIIYYLALDKLRLYELKNHFGF